MIDANMEQTRTAFEEVDRMVSDAAGRGRISEHSAKIWRAITFHGTKHHLVIEFDEDAMSDGDRFMTLLPELTMHVPDSIVTDVTMKAFHRAPDDTHLQVDIEVTVTRMDDEPTVNIPLAQSVTHDWTSHRGLYGERTSWPKEERPRRDPADWAAEVAIVIAVAILLLVLFL